MLFAFLCLLNSNVFCQETDIEFVDTELNIDVDESVFVHNLKNSYFTENESAAMQFSLIPESYDELKNRMMSSEKKGFKKEITIDSVKVLLVKTTQTKENNEYTIAVYCKRINSNSTLVLNSFYQTKEKLKMRPLIEKALLSAKIKE